MSIIDEVRKKKEFMFLSDEFIMRHVTEAIRLDTKLRADYHAQKEKAIKELVKLVRDKARKIYGVFQDVKEITIREENLTAATIADTQKISQILESHLSTNERMPYYEQFWEQILSLTQNPTTILDIGCGLNPVSFFVYAKPKSKPKFKQYLAVELSPLDAEQLNTFFTKNNLPAKAYGFDAVHDLDKYPTTKVDVVLLLKALDTFEHQKRYVTYEILDKLEQIGAKYIVATFPRATVKGFKTDRGDQIMWFEKMLPRKNLLFHRILFPTEVCYICFTDERNARANVDDATKITSTNTTHLDATKLYGDAPHIVAGSDSDSDSDSCDDFANTTYDSKR
jgi:hypothetical protein